MGHDVDVDGAVLLLRSLQQAVYGPGNVGHFDGDRGILVVYPIAGHKHQGGIRLSFREGPKVPRSRTVEEFCRDSHR